MAKVKTYVEFLYGGLSLTPPKQVKSRRIKSLTIPSGAIGLRFYCTADVRLPQDGIDEVSILTAEEDEVYYIGWLYTAKQLAKRTRHSHHLTKIMKESGAKQVILLFNGDWKLYDPKIHTVISPSDVRWSLQLEPVIEALANLPL